MSKIEWKEINLPGKVEGTSWPTWNTAHITLTGRDLGWKDRISILRSNYHFFRRQGLGRKESVGLAWTYMKNNEVLIDIPTSDPELFETVPGRATLPQKIEVIEVDVISAPADQDAISEALSIVTNWDFLGEDE